MKTELPGRGSRWPSPSSPQQVTRSLDHGYGKLTSSERLIHQSIRKKVTWYRNSFEEAETIPITQIPLKPVVMDPPLEIPSDLRPVGHKTRYIRTVRLIDEQLPEAVNSFEKCIRPKQVECVVRFQDTLRSVDTDRNSTTEDNHSVNSQIGRMHRSVSHGAVFPPRATLKTMPSAGSRLTAANEESEIGQCGNDIPSCGFESALRRETMLGNMRLAPLDGLPSENELWTGASRRKMEHGQSRRVSVDEVQNITNSNHYFGPNAKSEFFTRYHQLCAKPYLFVKKPSDRTSARDKETHSDDDDFKQHNRPSRYLPAFPTAGYLQSVSEELGRVGSGIGCCESQQCDNDLPTDDNLSPRSQFLSSCITRPHLAVSYMMRKTMTKVFDFSFQSLGDEFISEFAKCLVNDLPFVEEINVRDNRLSDDGVNALLMAVTKGSSMMRLHLLDISQNEIGSKSAGTLRAYVVTPHCSLRMLLIDNADIDDSECAAFMTAFEKNLSIQHLWVSRNSIGKSENLNVVQPHFVTGGEAIASMLHTNLVLVQLDLSWNYLRLESSITLARSLLENHTLTELNLAYNACGDAGSIVFGEALRFNNCLQVLDLSYNSIGCKGALVLAHALRENTTIRSLQLNGNSLGREGGQRLLLALCENRSEHGCDVGLHACNLTASFASAPAQNHRVGDMTTQSKGGMIGVTTTSTPPTAARSAGNASDVNVDAFPLYGAMSSRIFDSKEPTGRYILNLEDPYDKMMAMELVRLATFKKGCRFLRLDHRTPSSGSSSKRSFQLVRKEHQKSVSIPVAVRSGETGAEDQLETIGLDALFKDVDRDNSGSIDHKELMGVLNRIGLFPRMEQLANVLKQFDFNSSGYLEREHEFSAFFFNAVFQMIDSDGSGKIDADEVEEAFKMLGVESYDEKEIAEAIAIYDITGDAEIEESEFVAFMKDRLLERIKLEMGVDNERDGHPYAMLVDTATQKPWVVPDDGQLEIDFLYEREAFATMEEAHRYCKISQDGIDHLIHNIVEVAGTKSEQEELYHVAVHESEIKFTAAQAYQLLEACGNLKKADKKIESIAHILPQMLTARDAQVLVSRTLTLRQRCRLKAQMGSAYSVIMGNPTAHYIFDLAKPNDRAAVSKIAEVAQSEKLFSKFKSARADTSQHNNWENFRNEQLDGDPIVLTNTFFHVLPTRGKLSFDYVSTTRPKRGTVPMSERRFQQLIRELQTSISTNLRDEDDECSDNSKGAQLDDIHPKKKNPTAKPSGHTPQESSAAAVTKRNSVSGRLRLSRIISERSTQVGVRGGIAEVPSAAIGWRALVSDAQATFQFTEKNTTKENVALKIVQIESAICDRWLSCEQAAQIVACMPTAFHSRAETARILFTRIIDVDNVFRLVDDMTAEDRQVFVNSIGWLNIMNPMFPDREYSLDLSVSDEREFTKLLVELAINEPGENWLNQSFSNIKGEPGIPGWKLPVRWEKEDPKDGGGVNRSGFLELEYYSGADRGCAPMPALRKSLLSRVLAGTKQYYL